MKHLSIDGFAGGGGAMPRTNAECAEVARKCEEYLKNQEAGE